MPYDPRRHNRQSHRLADCDYSQPGAYFVTMNTQDRQPLFGEVVDGEMLLSSAGRIVQEVWRALETRYPRICLDAFVVMPDHVHGIIWIVEEPLNGDVATAPESGGGRAMPDGEGKLARGGARAIHESPQPGERDSPEPTRTKRRRMLIPLAVGYFKMNTAKRINELRSMPGARVWQRDYYERVIRSEKHLYAVRRYIRDNTARWAARQEDA